MQKIIDTIVTALTLIVAIALWFLGGKNYLPMRTGAMPAEGIGTSLLCFMAAVLNLLIFVYRLVKMFTEKGASEEEETIEDGSAGMNQFLTRQETWIKEWCRDSSVKAKISAYLWAAGTAAVLVGIGFLAGVPFMNVMTLHLPLGLLFGEILVGLSWPLSNMRNNWKRILKGMKKSIQKALPSAEAQNEFFEEYFATEKKWELVEKAKETTVHLTVGEKYFAFITTLGSVSIVDSRVLNHIDIFEEIITVRVNNVRTYTHHYVAEFFDTEDKPKKKRMGAYSFNSRGTLDAFVRLVQERNGDRIAVNDVGTKNI